MRLTPTPLFATALLLALTTGGVQAQDTEVLRPHIIHAPNADGDEEYRDDRTPTLADTTICFLYVGRKQTGALWLRLQVRYSA